MAEIAFRRREWGSDSELPVRVIAVRTRERERGKQLYLWDHLDWTVLVYLANDVYWDPGALDWKYDQRDGIEPLIAEWKTAWGIGKHSCSSFCANAASMQLKLLAHNLLHRLYYDVSGEPVPSWVIGVDPDPDERGPPMEWKLVDPRLRRCERGAAEIGPGCAATGTAAPRCA